MSAFRITFAVAALIFLGLGLLFWFDTEGLSQMAITGTRVYAGMAWFFAAVMGAISAFGTSRPNE